MRDAIKDKNVLGFSLRNYYTNDKDSVNYSENEILDFQTII
ncbi:hypothetical protein [Mesomycoplasma neurolyticum]|uniref:Uncharacterized protein n=1 Tax=Mesomycoplasma neurolyticum TaxID=2120 RepID=A0A449A6I4_9BACT|nr:hypothetical protein [Mesomycoplasma neurolyticum]VEU59854.1 Uncharacterised protein [Mesomycoplasma neurolyticum]